MRLLFVGESWLGSSARSLKESLRRTGVRETDEIDEINEDLYFSKPRRRWLRAINRLLGPAYRQEFGEAVRRKVSATRPEVILVYKGSSIDASLIREIKAEGIFTVNVFPDYSPHAYGDRLRAAMGEYDLVISTKPFHPPLWQSIYGYSNLCVFVPHGYDSTIHLIETPPTAYKYDLGLIATWRPEYHTLMQKVAGSLGGEHISVAIAGNGWIEQRQEFPRHWIFVGERTGKDYARWAQSAKILVAPVNRDVVINNQRQPGDEDTTRTYELAAAYCFYIHQRTEFVQGVFDEEREVPLFDDAADLVRLIRKFINQDDLRFEMATAAHARAVPAYSIDQRAKKIAALIQNYAGLKIS